MASIKRRPDGKWRARYRDPEGRERAQHFDRKVDAERWLDTKRGELVRGDYIDPEVGRQTFRSYAEAWRDAQVHRPSTAAQLETNLRRHVYPIFGNRPLSSIKRSEVQAWVKGRGEVLAPATVTVVFRWFATILRAAIDDGVLRTSPCRGVKLPRRERVQVVPLEVEQVLHLVETIDERYRAAVVLAAGAGLRQGEVFGLEVRHVDFLRRTVRVEQQLVQLSNASPSIGPPKTEASARTVPLPQWVIDELAAHLARYPAGPGELVFREADGGPIRRTAFSAKVWRPTVTTAKVPAGIGMHALRHFYASLLIRHGESVKVVQSRLGHASAVETLNTYSHLWPDSDDRTRDAVDTALFGSVDLGAPRAIGR
jgi:integrase